MGTTPTPDKGLIARWLKAKPAGHGTSAFTKTATTASVTDGSPTCCCGATLIRSGGTWTHPNGSVLCG